MSPAESAAAASKRLIMNVFSLLCRSDTLAGRRVVVMGKRSPWDDDA